MDEIGFLGTEVIRLDEELVLKTSSGLAACEFESHGLRLANTKLLKHGPVA